MTPVELEILRDALSCLLEYHKYGEDMRIIGRGFHPHGRHGHSIGAVIEQLDQVIEKYEERSIPRLEPITNKTKPLDPKAWRTEK